MVSHEVGLVAAVFAEEGTCRLGNIDLEQRARHRISQGAEVALAQRFTDVIDLRFLDKESDLKQDVTPELEVERWLGDSSSTERFVRRGEDGNVVYSVVEATIITPRQNYDKEEPKVGSDVHRQHVLKATSVIVTPNRSIFGEWHFRRADDHGRSGIAHVFGRYTWAETVIPVVHKLEDPKTKLLKLPS